MKYSIVILLFLSLFTNSIGSHAKRNEIIVGKVINDTTFQVKNSSIIQHYWTDLLKENKIQNGVNKFEIQRHLDLETLEEYYILLGYSEANFTKVAFQVYKKGKDIVFNKKSLEGFCVICSGSNYSCSELGKLNGHWICGKVCSPDCKKSENVYMDKNGEINIEAFIKEYK